MSQAGSDSKEFDSVLRRELDEHPGLVRGKLDNGFEYVILPNSTPPQRFEAHLEMHAGMHYPCQLSSLALRHDWASSELGG